MMQDTHPKKGPPKRYSSLSTGEVQQYKRALSYLQDAWVELRSGAYEEMLTEDAINVVRGLLNAVHKSGTSLDGSRVPVGSGPEKGK